jgi:DUF4097 and DUF4098 domain-containing protein YvlB
VNSFSRETARTFPTGPQTKLRLKTTNGSATVQRHDRPEVLVRVTAKIYGESQTNADLYMEQVVASMRQEDSRVEVEEPNFSDLGLPRRLFRGARLEYKIWAPHDTDLNLEALNGDVGVEGLAGPVQISCLNGRVEAKDIERAITVESLNGRVSLSRCRGEVAVEGSNGRLQVEQIGGAVALTSLNGAVEIKDAGAGVRARTTNGGMRYKGVVRGDLDFEASNGSIRLEVPRDSRFEVDAESEHGRVYSDLAVSETGPAQDAVLPKVRLRTEHGSIRLEALSS